MMGNLIRKSDTAISWIKQTMANDVPRFDEAGAREKTVDFMYGKDVVYTRFRE